MDLFVSNISFKLKENGLKELFEPFGEVSGVKIIIDTRTRLNKGYGFVTMPNDKEAQEAINKMNGKEVMERKLVVTKSENKEEAKAKAKLELKPYFKEKKKKFDWLAKNSSGTDEPVKHKKRRGTGRGTTY